MAIPIVACEKLYLDLSKPAIFRATTTRASAWSQPFWEILPFDDRRAEVPFWTQAAWDDTKRGTMMLSPAATSSFPKLPPHYRRKCVHARDNVAQTGKVEVVYFHNPIARYER